MRKQEELTNPNSCMSRAKPDEMTFVLLARDVAAPAVIRFWASERIRLRKNRASDPQIIEALSCALAMVEAFHAHRQVPKEHAAQLTVIDEMRTFTHEDYERI